MNSLFDSVSKELTCRDCMILNVLQVMYDASGVRLHAGRQAEVKPIENLLILFFFSLFLLSFPLKLSCRIVSCF